MNCSSSRPSLDDVAEAFRCLDPRDRLETLTEYGRALPDLPEAYRALRDRGVGIVRECASPVFIMGRDEAGRVRIYADAPREAPVARGFVGLLIQTFEERPVEEIRSAPAAILDVLHLTDALSMRRRRGLTSIFERLRSTLSGATETEPVRGIDVA